MRRVGRIVIALLAPCAVATCQLSEQGTAADAAIDATSEASFDVEAADSSDDDSAVEDETPDTSYDGTINDILPVTTSLTAWYRADLGIGATPVDTWTDQSGLHDPTHNLTASGTGRPSWQANDPAYNYQATVSFDGTEESMRSPTWTNAVPQPATVLIVGHAATAINILLDGIDSNRLCVAALSGLTEQYGGQTLDNTRLVTAPSVVIAVFDGPGSALYINGNPAANGADGTNQLTGVSLGARGFDGAYRLKGSLAEIAVYSRALSVMEITALAGYAASRYGISIVP